MKHFHTKYKISRSSGFQFVHLACSYSHFTYSFGARNVILYCIKESIYLRFLTSDVTFRFLRFFLYIGLSRLHSFSIATLVQPNHALLSLPLFFLQVGLCCLAILGIMFYYILLICP